MKSFKKTSQVLFALMAIVTVLPGCGKSKGPDVAANGVGIAGIYPAGMLQGSCYNFYNSAPGQGATLTFTGQGFISGQSIQGQVQGAAVGFPGMQYTRSNIAGDSVNVFMSGNSMIVQANLAPNTVDYFRYRGQQVCGLSFANNAISGNQILYSVYIYTSTGWSQITL